MKTYVGTKIIRAKLMTRGEYNDYRGWQLPADEDGADEGYLVEYLDGGKPNHPNHPGYVSWSPKEQFDKAYRPTTGMSFGLAIEALKQGKKVARKVWDLQTGACLQFIGSEIMYLDQRRLNQRPVDLLKGDIDLFDMMAEDWMIVE